MTDDPSWLECADVIQIHDEQVRLYGGLPGLRDEGALESALARPKNLSAYRSPDIFELAASYAFALARGHCFFDGNKRTAFAASVVFLLDHEFLVLPDSDGHTDVFERLAAGEMTEEQLSDWFRLKSIAIPPPR